MTMNSRIRVAAGRDANRKPRAGLRIVPRCGGIVRNDPRRNVVRCVLFRRVRTGTPVLELRT